jgi:tetratricopeptide (TPR) repeat protein
MKRALAFLLCFALAGNAIAQSATDVEQAKTFFTAGAQAYDRGDFTGAIQAFERAYQLAPRAAILFSIAQAYRRQYYIDGKPDNLKSAVKNYREYLKQAPDGNRKADASQALAELGPAADRLGEGGGGGTIAKSTRVSLGSNAPGAVVSMDGAPPSPAPFIHDVTPGNHTFVVSADGFVTRTESIRIAEGDFAAHEIQLKELPGKLFIDTDGGAQVLVDGRIVGTAPFPSYVEVEPGTRQVAVTHNGFEPVVREVDIARGETKKIDVGLRSTGQRRISRVLVGAGVAGVVTSGVFLAIAGVNQATAKDLRDKRDAVGLSADELSRYESARNDRNTWLGAAVVAAGMGVAIGATGMLLYLFDQPPLNLTAPKTEKKPEKEKGPLDVTVGLGSITIQGTF